MLLITGADGFAGKHFVEHAKKLSVQTHLLQSRVDDVASLNAEIASVQPSKVLHLAGISFVGHPTPSDFYAVNVVGTTNLLDALAACPTPAKSVVIASSANVYGNAQEQPISEATAFMPLNHYAASKVAMEQMASLYRSRLPIKLARLFNFTGPGQANQFLIPKLVDAFAQRAPTIRLGNTFVEREYNDVRFVCDALMRLMNPSVAPDVYNICSGQAYSLDSILAKLERISGHHPTIQVDPALVRPNELKRLCGDPQKLFANAFAEAAPSIPSIEETLRWMLDEYRKHP